MVERIEDSIGAMEHNMASALRRIEQRLASLEESSQAALVSLCRVPINKFGDAILTLVCALASLYFSGSL